jgi:uncharacterized membrane protein YphA (DoxX/SURF4 family)
MNIVRCLARPLLAASFIDTGLTTLRDPQQTEWVRPLVDRVAKSLHLHVSPQTFLRVDGGVMIVAGGLLALGRLPRLSALVLVTASAPTACAGYVRWEGTDPEQRRAQRAQMVARLGLIGGALLATGRAERRSSRKAHRTAGRARTVSTTTGRRARQTADALR